MPKLQAGIHTITVRVDNTDYPTKGGHLTLQDTQTNWNGITGRMELQFYGESQLTNIRLESNLAKRTVRITAILDSNSETTLAVSAQSFNSEETHAVDEREFPVSTGLFSVDYVLGQNALLWSEGAPNLYNITLVIASIPAVHRRLYLPLRICLGSICNQNFHSGVQSRKKPMMAIIKQSRII